MKEITDLIELAKSLLELISLPVVLWLTCLQIKSQLKRKNRDAKERENE